MANAREILDARLAKGEISLEEYKTLAAAIADNPSPAPSQMPSKEHAVSQIAPAATTTPSRLQRELGGIVLAAVGLLIYGYWSKSNDMQRALTQCMAQVNNASICNCFISEAGHRVSIFHFTPPIKWFLSEPSKAVENEIIRTCSKR